MPKRKRGIAVTKTSHPVPKKKRTTGDRHPHGAFDPEKEYKVRDILGETKTKYLIDWEDDEITGAQYPQTWEPKSHVNQLAIDAWHKKKAADAAEVTNNFRRLTSEPGTDTEGTPDKESISTPKKDSSARRSKGRAHRKVIESSSPTQRQQASATTPIARTEIQESPQLANSVPSAPAYSPSFQSLVETDSTSSSPVDPRVRIPEPPSSYLAGVYEKYDSSSRPASSNSNHSSATSVDDSQSVSLSHSQPQQYPNLEIQSPEDSVQVDASACIPESQLLAESQQQQHSLELPLDELHYPGNTIVPQDLTGLTSTGSSRLENPLNSAYDGSLILISTENADGFKSQSSEKLGSQSQTITPRILSDDLRDINSQPQDLFHPDEEDDDIEVIARTSWQTSRLHQDSEDLNSDIPDQAKVTSPVTAAPILAGSPKTPTTRRSTATPQSTTSARHSRAGQPSPKPIEQRHTTPSPRQSKRNFGSRRKRPATIDTSSFPFATQISFRSTQSEGSERSAVQSDYEHDMEQQDLGNPQGEKIASNSALTEQQTETNSSSFPQVPPKPLPPVGESAPSQIHPFDPSSSPASSGSSKTKAGEIFQLLKQNYIDNKEGRNNQDSLNGSTGTALPTTSAGAAALLQLNPTSPLLTFSDGMRSPSAVPAIETVPEISREEMNTSERYYTLLPQAQGSSIDPSQRNSDFSQNAGRPSSQYDSQNKSMHVVPITLLGHQRDQYFQKIWYFKELFEAYIAGEHASDVDHDVAVQHALKSLRLIAIHPDLDNVETATQSSASQEIQAQWDIDCSAKFRFLKHLLVELREEPMHIAIIGSGGRLLNILDNFLSGIHVTHDMVGSTGSANDDESMPFKTGLRVSVVGPTTDVGVLPQADMVISLEPRFGLDQPVIRALMSGDSTVRAPILLVLVVPRTVEHIERCLLDSLDDTSHQRALVKATLKYRNESGRHEPDQVGPKEAAEAIVAHIVKRETEDWPLAGLNALEGLDSQTESDVADAGHEDGSQPSKRLRGDSPDLDSGHKRQRVLPSSDPEMTTINPQDIEVTRISDSVGKATEENIDLNEQLQRLHLRFDEYAQALGDLQYRFEDQRAELIAVTAARDKEINRAAIAVQRATTLDQSNTALRAERSELKQQLSDLNERLLSHAIPERREYEALRVAHEQALLDKDKADKAAQQSAKEREYFSSAYQEASSQSHQLRQTNAELTEQLAAAQALATGETARARAISRDTATRALTAQLARLRDLVRDREAGLKFRDEEIARLKEAGRGRMGTRNSSVPRSPRLGSPMRGNGRGSRQPSPNAGDGGRGRAAAHLHPLRNG